MDLHQDLIDLLSAFDRCEVDYLVVGGWAVSTHGKPRYTKDLDLWIGMDPDNLTKVVRALGEFGAPPALVANVASMKPDEFVFFGTPPARIDLLRQIPGVTFEEAWRRRLDTQWNGHDVHVIGLDDLIAAKRAADRPKDLADLKQLEALRQQR